MGNSQFLFNLLGALDGLRLSHMDVQTKVHAFVTLFIMYLVSFGLGSALKTDTRTCPVIITYMGWVCLYLTLIGL